VAVSCVGIHLLLCTKYECFLRRDGVRRTNYFWREEGGLGGCCIFNHESHPPLEDVHLVPICNFQSFSLPRVARWFGVVLVGREREEEEGKGKAENDWVGGGSCTKHIGVKVSRAAKDSTSQETHTLIFRMRNG
jgi:hypothetical protein